MKLIVTYELDIEDFAGLMEDDDLTIDEVISQLMDDGELELNEIPIIDWSVE